MRVLTLLITIVALFAAAAGVAFAFWTSPGTGNASAATGTLNPPTNVTVPGTSAGSVAVSWSAPAVGTNPSGYYVTRIKSDNTTTNACGTSPSSPTTAHSCVDSVPASGSFTYTVTAVYHSWTATSVASNTVVVTVPAKVAFTAQPPNAEAGSAFTTAVTVEDAAGTPVPSAGIPVTVAIGTNPGGGTLSGTLTVNTNSSGVATFTGLSIDKTGTGYTLNATSPGLTGATSSAFNITPGAAAKLAFTTQPSSSATGGTVFATQPVVTLQDANGNTVTSSSAGVTLALTSPGGATLTCTNNPVNASAGVATFAGCKIDKVGTYTLTATSGTLIAAQSTSITVAVGPAAKLAFTTQPSSSATGGTVFATQPSVSVTDLGGNVVTSASDAVALALTTSGGATLSCTNNPVNASAGVAAFAGCKIDKVGSYTLTATSGSLTSAQSTSITVSVGAAARLAFTTQPSSSATGGTAFGTQPVVTVQDAGGNTVTTATDAVTLALTTPAGATLSCTSNPSNASSGVVTFAGCKIDKVGTYTLTATSGTLAPAQSTSITVTVGSAARLAFTTQPSSSATGGTAFGAQPVVTVQDAGGNTVTTSTASVTLALTTAGGATLTCTSNPSNASSGVATFGGCAIDKPGTYTLTATSGALTSAQSNSITVTVGPGAKLAFTAQPSSSATSGTAFTTQPVVQLQDAGGNNVTTSGIGITLTLTAPAGGATLTCTANPVTTTAAGAAAFTGCKIDKVGTYTLTATSGTLTSAQSSSITVNPGTATKLGFTTQPSTSASGGTAFGTQPVVAVQDALGNTVTTSSAPVALALTTAAGATLTCTNNTVNATSGVASFAGCNIDKPGTYTLTASSSGLASATSTSITVSVGAAAKLAFTTQPSSTATSNTAFGSQPVVTIQDAGGNTVTSSSALVSLALTTPAGATLSCTSGNSKAASSGVTTFAGCKIDLAGTYTLTATSSGLTSATSTSITVSAGTATKLAFTTQPSNSFGGTAFGAQPVVAVEDAAGNVVTSATNSVSLSISSGPASGTLSCTTNPKAAVAGVATFAGCKIDKVGTYTLAAAATGLSGATSTSFTITAGTGTALCWVATTGGACLASPDNIGSGQTFTGFVELLDAGGNPTTSSSTVTVAVTVDPTGDLTPPTAATLTIAPGQNTSGTSTSTSLPNGSSKHGTLTGHATNVTVSDAVLVVHA